MTATTRTLVDTAAWHFVEYRRGREDHLEQLVRLLTPTLWHLARGCGLERADAEDVVQQSWLQLVAKADSIREPQAVVAWIGSTVRREAWRVRREQAVEAGIDPAFDLPDASPGPEDVTARNETSEMLARHLARLSQRCRALLRVISRGGPPDYAALAESLGMPMGSIGPTRGRCLAKLREALLADPHWSSK